VPDTVANFEAYNIHGLVNKASKLFKAPQMMWVALAPIVLGTLNGVLTDVNWFQVASLENFPERSR